MNKKHSPFLMFCRFADKIADTQRIISVGFQMLFMSMLALQIFLRYFFSSPIYGIEEGVTALVVWFAAFGSVVVTRDNGHAQIEFLVNYFPEKVRNWLSVAKYSLCTWICFLMTKGGIKLFKVQKHAAPAGGLPFSKTYYYALPIIIMGITMGIICISHIIKIVMGIKDSKASAKAACCIEERDII